MVMAEPKRLQFTTLNNKPEEKPKDSQQPTVRFTLSLVESTDKTCSEFSYTELLKNESKEKKVTENGKEKGPFGDDDVNPDEIAAIARSFEEKYGPKPGKKKKHRGRIQDLVDLGEGYDESDAFIDNSEAYDEVVPPSLSTKLGGFYINSGKLEFKDASDDSLDDFAAPLRKKKKKRIISDSDEEDKDEKKKKIIKKRKLKEGLDGDKKKKKRLMNGDGEKSFKKPKEKPVDKDKLKKKKLSPTVGELLKQQTESMSTPTSHLNGAISLLDMEINSPSSQEAGEMAESAFLSNIDSVIDAVIAEDKDGSDSREMVENLSKPSIDPTSTPKLPQGLSPELELTIDKLKEASKNSVDGKCKFFTNDVNNMLLRVELCCRQLPCGHRTTIYGHLAAFLPCGKETLIKRAKKLRLNQQDDQIRGPLEKLRDAVNAVMPSLQEKHDLECQKKAQLRYSEVVACHTELVFTTDKIEQERKERYKSEKIEVPRRLAEETKDKGDQKEKDESDESGDEDEKSQETQGKKKIHKGPRKKFEWTDHIRSLLCEVVRVKMKICEMSKNRTQTAEEYLKSFLEREVKPLWPKGWMQTRMLFKESRSVHASWTNPQKPKKTVILSKSTPAVGSAPSTPTVTSQKPSFPTSNSASKIPSASSLLSPSSSNSLLGYAGASNPSAKGASAGHVTSSNTMAKKSDILTNSVLSTANSGLSGLSLLAESAASHKPMDRPPERSWDHVVSDILKSSYTPVPQSKDPKSGMTSQDSKLAKGQAAVSSAASSGFMAQFQKYAADMISQKLQEAETVKKVSPTSQQKSNLMIQKQDQQQFVHKIQMATQQKTDKPQPAPAHQNSHSSHSSKSFSPNSSRQISYPPSQAKPPSTQVTSQQVSPQRSLIGDEVYKQLLESSSRSLISQVSKPTQQRTTSSKTSSITTGQKPSSVKVVPVTLSKVQQPAKNTVTKVITVGGNSTNNSRKITVHTTSKSPMASGKPGTVQVTGTSPSGVQQRSQASPKDQGLLSSTKQSQQTFMGSDLPHINVSTAANLLQTLFGQIQENEKQQFSGLNTGIPHSSQSSLTQKSPVQLSHSTQKQPPQSKSQQSSQQIWSMSSLVPKTTISSSSGHASSSFTPGTGIPKPRPGYQSVTLSSLTPPLPQPDQSFMGLQNNYSNVPTSPLIGQQNPLSGQTSPNQLPGMMSPYSLAPPQHHSSLPYHGQYTDKSRSPHGY